MDELADRYVRLALALDKHDEGYVDAYFGPPSWREEAAPDLATIKALAVELGTEVEAEEDSLRRRFLLRQVNALAARVDLVGGAVLSFDEEARALYDAEVPHNDEDYFRALVDEVGELLPGSGAVAARYAAFVSRFVVPPDRVEGLARVAIEECRRRTARWLSLPEDEAFELSFTTGEAWGGQNYYQGGFRSKIILNLDVPLRIDRILDLAGHEGYPGHHVAGVLIERDQVIAQGWNELSVFALFSPAALLAEGAAMLAVDVAFDERERSAYEREVLYPYAGLDPSEADRYEQLRRLAGRLGFAVNEAARRYLNGSFSAAEAAQWNIRYALMTPTQAEQRVRFIDRYRSYVVNYNVGEDLARSYLDTHGGTPDNPARRWELHADLLRFPMIP